jgi:hypothetical protein
MKITSSSSFPVIRWSLALVLLFGTGLGATDLQTQHKRTELRQALQPNPEANVARRGTRELTPAERREMRELLRQLSRDQGRTPP